MRPSAYTLYFTWPETARKEVELICPMRLLPQPSGAVALMGLGPSWGRCLWLQAQEMAEGAGGEECT